MIAPRRGEHRAAERAARPFTPLRVRSHGSLLYGLASPEALVERALELGYESLALTDRDNLYHAVRFDRFARSQGLRPLLGCALSCASGEALLFPIDRRGYARLCALITRRRLDPDFDLAAAFARAEEPAPAAGLHLVVESAALAAALLRAGVRPARGVRGPLGGASAGIAAGRGPADAHEPQGGLWLGVRGLPRERALLRERAEASRALGVPLVATGDCALLLPADHDAHRVAVTAAAGEMIERMPPSAFCAIDAWLAPPAEWDRRVRAACAAAAVPGAAEEALANNRRFAASFRLDLEYGTPIFPHAPLPPGRSGARHLYALSEAGIRRRYGDRPGRALSRLHSELAMIDRLGFTDYFLLVAEIVGFARARGIPTVGRGSGASSIVAYALGITNVDPIRYELTFERFLNPARRDCPDLDIDLCWKRRDEVIDHVYETYGRDRVAMISTHATLGARSAFREAAKALGVPNTRVNALARRIPRALERPYLEHLAASPEARAVDWREPVLARALALAERLDGVVRHLSIHCGGVVIADRELTHYVPLERAAKDIVVTQFEMRAIEAIGLVKMDLLGNRALTTIGECLELAREHRGANPAPAATHRAPALRTLDDLDRQADADPATMRRIAAGDTLNCFQLESPAMRHLLRMLDAGTLDDVIAAVALVRPGPAESGMKEAYCRRQRGLEAPAFLHDRLVPVLQGTHGVMLYEEDVLRVAAALTGISLAEGDDLRRAIGAARDDEEFRSLERGFVAQAARAGVAAAAAHAVWRDLTRFAAYSFCKAHAAGYGTLGLHCAYLKTHFPAEFAVAILNHHAGMYATWVHVEDLRRQAVEFRPPCALRSACDTTLERGPGTAVRVGLGRVFGLGRATAERIVAERAARPFASLADFIDRARPAPPEIEALILAGAMDWTGRSRPTLLLETRAGEKGWSNGHAARLPVLAAAGAAALAVCAVAPVAVPDLPEFAPLDLVHGEMRATGMWFSAHPLDLGIPASARASVEPAARLPQLVGRRVAVLGLPCAYRRVETKTGGQMLFLTVADRSGLAECVLFPEAYRAAAAAVRGQVVRVEGRVDDTLSAITLVADRVTAIAPAREIAGGQAVGRADRNN